MEASLAVFRFVAVSCLVLGLSSDAESQRCPAGAAIRTVNGIRTKKLDAQRNLRHLERLVKARLSPEEQATTEFGLIYNTTQGGFDDVAETLMQSNGLEESRWWRWFAGIEAFPDSVQAYFDELASKTVFDANRLDFETFFKIATQSFEDMSRGKEVVLVAHSQGNLYTNSVAAYLTDSEKRVWATVNVAVPDSKTEGALEEYTTLAEDLVIYPIASTSRLLSFLPPPLLPNVTDSYLNPYARNLNHGFVEAYLGGEPSRSRIVDATVATMRTLAENHVATAGPCISIDTADCSGSHARFTGTAIGPVGSFVHAQTSTVGWSEGTQVSFCQGWTGTTYDPPYDGAGLVYCSRRAGDPPRTRWSASHDVPVPSHVTSAEASLNNPSTIIEVVPGNHISYQRHPLATTTIPFSCPGVYP